MGCGTSIGTWTTMRARPSRRAAPTRTELDGPEETVDPWALPRLCRTPTSTVARKATATALAGQHPRADRKSRTQCPDRTRASEGAPSRVGDRAGATSADCLGTASAGGISWTDALSALVGD
eukprot:scaffold28826_cov253-Isochrysis_galbana.AAC.6